MAGGQSVFRLGAEVRADPAIYEALGRLIDQWNSLEEIARGLISVLLEADDKRAEIALSAMQAQAMLNVLRALVHHVHPEKGDEFRELWVRIERAQQYRNQAAHSQIRGLHGIRGHHWESQKVKVSKKGGVTFGGKENLTPHKLRRRALYVRVVGLELLKFMDQILHPAWHASRTNSPA